MSTQLKNMMIISVVLLSTTAIPAGAMLETGGYNHAISNVNLMDVNDDNRISNEEYIKFYETNFVNLDVNQDGVLNATEWDGVHGIHQIALQTGGYQNQAIINSTGERSVTKKVFLEYHRSFIEAINQKRAESPDPQKTLARLLGG